MRQRQLQTTTMPQNGQSHSGGQLEGITALNPNWIRTWTQPASAKANGHLTVEALLPPGRWTWTVQLYHKQGAGKHVATISGFSLPPDFVPKGGLASFNDELLKVMKQLGNLNVITESGGTGSFQNYLDGGYQHPTFTFELSEPRKVILSLSYTGLHYIWTGATNLTCTTTKRPFYLIKHAAQNIRLVNEAIAQGANCVEFDIQPDGNRFFVKHPFPSPFEVGEAKTDTDYFPAFLSYLNGALRSGHLANLIFDCKKPETPNYPANLIRMVREAGIPDFACTLSIPKALAGAFISAARGMGFNCHFDSYLESSPSTVQEYINGVEALGTDFQGMGHDPFARAPFRDWLPWILELTNARDANRRYKKAYFWTVDDWVSLRNCLDYGVDGIITNKPDRLRAVLNEAPYRELLRLATLDDTRNLIVHGFEAVGPSRPLPEPVAAPVPVPIPVPAPVEGGQKLVFSYTGADQNFVVPAGITKLKVKLWGAGGGQNGGSGAFVSGELAVTPGETLQMVAGQGGQVAGLGETTIAAFGGGGTSTGDSSFKGGGGGGYTAIRRPTGFDNVVIAGSGGGGQFWGGGAGGSHESGGQGKGDNGAGGEGGNLSGGGRAGGGARGGTSGGSLTGGNGTGDSNAASGGGGSGYFGGAGGGKGENNGGGGGGCSLIKNLTSCVREDGKPGNNNTSVTAVTTAPMLPGGAREPDYVAGVGTGGANGQPGGNGMVVISY